jgi:1-acyl-sn-glycerol-3-phosphate acyltransferase
MLRDIAGRARSTLISLPLITCTTVLACAATAVAALWGTWGAAEAVRRAWTRSVLAASFVKVEVRGCEHLDPAATYIFCANHRSYFDPPLLIAALPCPVRFIAKKSLFSVPFLGWGMRLQGDIPIDRGNVRAAARSLTLAEKVARGGTSLVVFPEGERSSSGGPQPFLSGAFQLAIRTQLPVVPVAISGTREILPPGSLAIRSGRAKVLIGAAVSTEGLHASDRDALAGRVEQAVLAMLATGTFKRDNSET